MAVQLFTFLTVAVCNISAFSWGVNAGQFQIVEAWQFQIVYNTVIYVYINFFLSVFLCISIMLHSTVRLVLFWNVSVWKLQCGVTFCHMSDVDLGNTVIMWRWYMKHLCVIPLNLLKLWYCAKSHRPWSKSWSFICIISLCGGKIRYINLARRQYRVLNLVTWLVLSKYFQ